ncbi:MAG: hypothetical protein AABX16_04485 [Nanoarchaeota archaeon]|mgnify:FL=1
MAESDRVFKGKVKQSGVFNFKDFYEFLYDLLMEEGYDVVESKYAETKKSPDAKNVEITWKANKNISSYFKFSLTLRWLVQGLTKVKVKKDGEEISMDSASTEIDFTAELIKDPDNVWKKSYLAYLRELYDEYIIKQRIEDHEVKIFEEVNEVINSMKAYLAIEGQHA